MAKSSTLRQVAYQKIKNKIIWSEIPQGTPLREVPLAKELNMSRTPVKDAIAQLVREGLAVYVPGRGCSVKTFDAQDIHELFEFREALETFSLKKAVDHISAKSFHKMEQCCKNLKALSLRAKSVKSKNEIDQIIMEMCATDMSFHLELLLNSMNRYVKRVTSNLNVLSNIVMISSRKMKMNTQELELAEDLEIMYETHSKVLKAIKEKNIDEACGIISRHLRSACSSLEKNSGEKTFDKKIDWQQEVTSTLEIIDSVNTI